MLISKAIKTKHFIRMPYNINNPIFHELIIMPIEFNIWSGFFELKVEEQQQQQMSCVF